METQNARKSGGPTGVENEVGCTPSMPRQDVAVKGDDQSERRGITWTPKRRKQANEIITVVNGLVDYWPLTLRQIYYRLVAAGIVANTRSKYNDLSKVIKQMRLDGMLPWEVMEDRVRRVSTKRGDEDADTFIKKEMGLFLNGYSRCLVQGQENYVEVWVEKDALSRILEDVAYPYCIRVVTCRGYQSMTFLKAYADRADAAMAKGQTPVVLYFGDLDPSGVQMFEAAQQTLEDELDVIGVDFIRVGLNPEHVTAHNLPNNPDALKWSDVRAKGYVKRFGEIAVELDALHPATLETMAKEAIEGQFDMDLFEEQRAVEAMERDRLAAIKARVQAELENMTSHTGTGGRS